MSQRSEIQDELRLVLIDLGEAWSYRKRTNALTVKVGTFAAWVTVNGCPGGRSKASEYDENLDAYMNVERCLLLVSDATVELVQGDEVRDTANKVWSIAGVAGDAVDAGSVNYNLERKKPMVSGPKRSADL